MPERTVPAAEPPPVTAGAEPDAPAPAAPPEPSLTEADLLVEEVSIDGMCGVY